MKKLSVGDCFYQIRNGANIKQGVVDGGYPITRIETTANDKFNRDRMGFAGITDISKYESYILEDGDLLMSHINSVQYLGRTVLYEKQGNEKSIHGMNLLGLKANRELILHAYARYYFYSCSFREQIRRITKKSVNQASFAIADLKKVTLELPELSEQVRVVDIFDRVKLLIDERQYELQKLDDLIKARFVELFGNKGENPNSYEEDKLVNLYKFQYGKGNNIPEDKGEFPCYGSNGIVGHHTEYNNEDAPIIGHIGAYAGIVNWGAGKHYVTYNGVMCTLKTD